MDRMEIIRIPGYTEDEKVEIAKRHLIPKEMKAHGLKDDEWQITDAGLRDLIRYYSREAGVRNLEREIANLARKAVKAIVSNKTKSVEVTAENLGEYAGGAPSPLWRDRGRGPGRCGHRSGPGPRWAGETLTIESVMLPGKGRFQATGKLGDVMKEVDRRGAVLCPLQGDQLRHQAADLRQGGHPCPCSRRRHPQGRTRRAGLAMATSIISVLTGIAVRRDVAMTGEVTLRGRALPIGGLKEKLLARPAGRDHHRDHSQGE